MNDTTPVAETVSAKDFTQYAAKAPTSLHTHYAQWLSEKIGIPSEAVDVKTVQLAVSLYGDYQRSAERQAAKAIEDAEREAAKAKLAEAKAKSGTTKEARTAKKATSALEVLRATLTAAGDTEALATLDALQAKVVPATKTDLPGQERGKDIPAGGEVKDEPAAIAVPKPARKPATTKA